MSGVEREYSIEEYWNRYSQEISEIRNWVFATKKRYNTLISKLAPCFEGKPIGCIVVSDVKHALERVQGNKEGSGDYSEASIRNFRAVLWDIFAFAKDRGDAINIMRYFHADRTGTMGRKSSISAADLAFNPMSDPVKVKEELQRLREKKPYISRSLRIEQRIALVKRIYKGIKEDGRYACLAIMLYTGLRPAEARAVRWEDIYRFLDRKEARYIVVDKIMDQTTNVLEKTKTDNAYRRIPIHVELGKILDLRQRYIEEKTGKPAEGFICCKDDEMGKPCWSYELAAVADRIMNKKLLDDDALEGCILDLEDELAGNTREAVDSDVFDHFTLYVLRRNFWTWMQAETELTEMEKLYLMGHEMVLNRKNMRPKYNAEDRLLAMLDKMNRFAIRLEDHFPLITEALEDESPHTNAGNGFVLIEIPEKMCKNGAKLTVTLLAEEANDPIELYSVVPLRDTYGKIEMEVQTMELACGQPRKEINLEFDNWCAITNAKKRKKD